MKKYIITIINLETNTVHYLTKDDTNIDKTIEKELGGYNNLNIAMTSNWKLDAVNYQSCGTTKDCLKMYSILCHFESN